MERVIRLLNRTLGESEDTVIDLVRWETHSWPGFGEDAQAVINRQIEPGDIFVGILWRRIGTATKRKRSGTVEEFERAYELWEQTGRPSMMLYFNTAPPREDHRHDAPGQYREVERFKQLLGEKGALYWEYYGADEFEECVLPHLYREVLSQLEEPAPPAPVQPPSRTAWERVQDEKARPVLEALEQSRTGQGYRTVQGLARQTGLTPGAVEDVLGSYPQFVMRSRLPDTKGASLFKFRH